MASIEPFNRLVKLAARAFYEDITTKGENQQKAGRSDNRGIAVVILDALTRRQWVREEDLAKDLKLHTKQLRRTLRFFEEEKLITRDHRKETSKGAKIYNAAVAATVDGQKIGREGDEKQKLHTQSYCCLDYSQIYDVVRYRLHRMKKKLKDEVESKNTVQEYVCPNCNKRYNALDALRLISPYDEYFHCESCNGVLVAESDKFAAQEMGNGDDNASRRRNDKLKDMLRKMEEQLKPLIDQLGRVKDLPAPEFGNLQAWELRANAAGRALNGDNATDPSKSLHSGTPMPYVGETKVEVAFSGADDKGEVKAATSNTPMKVLPPWMIKEGMNLTKEQRGEANPEAKVPADSKASELRDDKKSSVNDETKNLQDEYVKAYYAALLKRQREQEEAVKKEKESSSIEISNNIHSMTSERQVGVKSKRDEFEGDDEVEWEEDPPAGSTSEQFKVNDLNVEADAVEEDEDENDWEDG
ncbi:transcription initiation factor IIE alpha subunit family protein [Striga asiatica]|uniref:Transcription initiation factor IIE alpha subunit family protein n=1 Tax=Striga asiatica TaxID=4170 RepID=A0A5A7PFD3_STRAF|nr:transcription initiation factor IIE alpha subunit family protein [Striga asiatica]